MSNIEKSKEEMSIELEELKKENESLKSLLLESTNLKLNQELQVHKIELETQNEELILAKDKAELAEIKYKQLFDFAPTGYFTLTKAGEIVDLNYCGEQMLGREKKNLISRKFSFFISEDSKPIFSQFLDKVFKSEFKETCEINMSSTGSLPIYKYLSGIAIDNENCFISLVDITGSKLAVLLRDTTELLSLFIKNSPIYTFIKDVKPSESKVMFASENFIDMIGIPGSAMIRKNMYDLFPAEFAEKFTADDWEVASNGNILKLDENMNGRNYTTIKFPIELGGKNLLAGYIIDITERTQALEALREREENLSITLHSIGDGVISTDKDGLIVRMNPVAEHLCGWNFAEAKGKALTDVFNIINAYTRETIADPVKNVIESGQVIGLANHTVLVSKDGLEYHISDSAAPIKNSDGSICGVVLVFSDITEKYKTEKILMESEERYKSLFYLAQEGIILISLDGKLVEINESFAKMHGYNIDEMLNMDIKEIDTPETAKMNPERILQILEGNHLRFESEHFHKDGHIIMFEVSAGLIYQGGKSFILSFHHDISDRKLAEAEIQMQNVELAEINESKDKFFSIIAHDLKTPFTGFLGLTKMMSENIHDFTLQELHEISIHLQKSASNLFQLLENLLEWSRMQRGITGFNPEICKLSLIIKQVLDIHTEASQQKLIELVSNIEEDITVKADVSMLNSVLRNLISNAIKFTPRGGRIEIGATSDGLHLQGGVHLGTVIYVKDTGIGMNEKMISNLFRIDYDVSRHGTENESSTGLGLLLCKEFIEKHGGRIWVESEDGKGSTFFFSL
jgi:PAS domain S-box-containing protein